MGLFYDIARDKVKRCSVCGCLMRSDHESDICECCLDDLNNYEKDEDPEEDELYDDLQCYDLEDQLKILLGEEIKDY